MAFIRLIVVMYKKSRSDCDIIFFRSGALNGKTLLVRIIENNKNYAYFRLC